MLLRSTHPYPYSTIAYYDTANASYRLRVRAVPPPDLNFTSQLNLNGHTNVVSGILADNQRAFFRVAVPATVDGAPVLGWKLDLNQTNGSPSVRVRRDVLPWDGDTASTPFSTGSAIIAPPYLTPGTWFVEVKGSGSTDFTLLSSAITTNTLQRPLWTMPSLTETTDTPGLARPEFGDTGTADDGTPLSGDRGVDLEQGQFHFYAVIVPTNNAGLLRTELVAISGNPDLYLRVGVTPTLTHYSTGGGGFTLYDRWLTGTGTEYGNWVPLDGRAQTNLTPGLWVLGVRATGYSNARYRLRLGCGNPAAGSRVQPVDLASGFSGAGTLSGGDWRYYCVSAPTNGLVPASWTFTFARSIGNARVFVRDTVAPGDPETKRDYGYYTQYHYERDWYSDNKNQGPYPHFDVPGTYTLDTPPLRPGAVYWLGVWSPDDSAFTLTFATNGPVDNVANSVAFYGGSVTNLLPPNSVTMYRMDVPPDATRLKLYGTNTASVGLSLEQGTLAQTGGGAHWRSSGANPSLDQSLTQPYWPWRPGFTYYLAVNNTAGTAQAFSLFADGRNAATEDNDNDGLPDAWEILYFGNTSYTGTSDPDGDGNNNLMEFADGTKPNNANSAKYLLTVNVSGPGTVGRTPALPKYDKGTNVILTATADAGNRFVGWTGFINATSASVAIMVVTNCTVTAIFVPVTVSVEAFVVGGLKREVYTNIPGVLLSGLTNNAKFLGNAPDLVDPLWQFESTPNWGDNYGARLSGWLLPPTNGNYRFYLASDDQGALFLSPDATPANKVLIATEPEWNGYREYVTGANQASRGSPAVNISTNIPLIAGRAYYVEALLKESVGGDYLSVAWQPPGGPALANGDPPIYGRYLASGTPLTGPLLLLSAASLTNSSRITVRFERPVEGGTATQPTNYLVAGATVISASLAPDSRLVVLGVSGLTGATFDLRVRNVADAFGNPLSPNSAIVGQVLPQQSQDIGTASNPLEPGVPLPCAVGEFVVVAGGSDIWGTADHGHFVYEQRTGDFDVQVRVEALEPVSANTKAGLMVRETLAAGSREILAAINPTGPTRDGKNGGLGSDAYDFAIRATTAGSTTDWFLPSVDVNAPSYPNAWVRLKRQGSTFSGYRSSDGNTWTLIGQTTQSLPATVYVGPATTANNNSPGFTALARYHSYGTLGFNPPVITAPPADLTVSVGASAALAVTATGAAPLAYQWRYNGTNIAGATNATLALQNLQASNAGDYRVVVSNAAGLVNSLPARLTVLEPLVLSARLNLGTGSLSLGFNGPPGQRYQIELSLDLKVWLPVLNITNTTGSSHVELPLPGGPMGFYRAVLLP